MRNRFLAALALLALALPSWGEVTPKSLSVSQTVTSYSFPSGTKKVLVISDGASDACYYRLFHNAETSADATASATTSVQIKSGESKSYPAPDPPGTAWRTISAICSSGQTATFRIESF